MVTDEIERVLDLLIKDKGRLLLLLNRLLYLVIVFWLQSFFKCFELPLHRDTQLTGLWDLLYRYLGIDGRKLDLRGILHLPLLAGANLAYTWRQNLLGELQGQLGCL